MTQEGQEAEAADSGPGDLPMSAEQLRAYEWGWGAMIMPARNGWKIHYYSVPNFEEEPGTLFPTFDEAMEALYEVLPEANSEEQKEKARDDLQKLLQDSTRVGSSD